MGQVGSAPAAEVRKGVRYDAHGNVSDCIFCRIRDGEPVGGTRVLYETDNVIVFRPRDPASDFHFLAVSKEHVANVNALSPAHAQLLREMRDAGAAVVAHYVQRVPAGEVDADVRNRVQQAARAAEAGEESPARMAPPIAEPSEATARRLLFGFHRPPFNSIDHLHLHCIATPFRGFWSSVKYRPGSTWTVPLAAVMAAL